VRERSIRNNASCRVSQDDICGGQEPLALVGGSSTTMSGLRLIISLAGCVIIERPLACVWICRLRRVPASWRAGWRVRIHTDIGSTRTPALVLRHGSARNNRKTECRGAYNSCVLAKSIRSKSVVCDDAGSAMRSQHVYGRQTVTVPSWPDQVEPRHLHRRPLAIRATYTNKQINRKLAVGQRRRGGPL
jgi:hypothetical protein